MTKSANFDVLGPEIARLPCRTRYAIGCDMGHLPIGFFVGPVLGGLLLTFLLYVAHREADVLNKLGLLTYMSVASIHLFTFIATTIVQYWFWFSAPDRPITIHENGVKFKRRKLPFSEIIGVRLGSGEVEDPTFGFTVTPIGRLCQAMDNAAIAHQNVVNCSIHIVKRDFQEFTISKGLAMYEPEDLEKLIKSVESRSLRDISR